MLGCRPGEVVFTSGGTEADNLAVLGVLDGCGARPRVAVCPAAEHHAVLHAVESVGGRVVGVDASALVDLDALAAARRRRRRRRVGDAREQRGRRRERPRRRSPRSCGTQAPRARAALRRRAGRPVARRRCRHGVVRSRQRHRAQARRPEGDRRPRRARRDAAAGPADRRRPGARSPQRHAGRRRRRRPRHRAAARGGGADRDRRARRQAARPPRRRSARRRCRDSSRRRRPTATAATSSPARATCACPTWPSEAVLFLLDDAGICASAASSCASGAQQASHVLAAMGIDDDLARGSLRFSLGPETTDADVDAALAVGAGGRRAPAEAARRHRRDVHERRARRDVRRCRLVGRRRGAARRRSTRSSGSR